MKELNECTIDELKELARQGQKFEQMRDAYNETSDKVMAMAAQLKEIALAINPLAIVKKGKSGYVRGERKEIVESLYEKMKAGMYLTRDLIEKSYPEKDEQWVSNLLYHMKDLAHIKKVKDGVKIRLFYQD
jgi:uncharacterized coiled-coil DUF342 family protein